MTFSKTMLRSSLFLAATSLLAACSGGGGKSVSDKLCYPATKERPLEGTLVLNTSGGTFWDAFAKAHIANFERDCGVKVQTIVTTHNFPQLRAYVQSKNVPYDVSYTGSPWEFDQGIKEGLFHALPADFWKPSQDTLLPGSFNEYGIWLSTYSEVLVWSKKTLKAQPQSWADLWDTGKFPGPRTFYDHPYMIVIALLADGVSPDAIYPIDDAKLKRAFAKLDKIRPQVRNFWATGDEPIQGINRGDFTIGVAQSGRVISGLAAGFPIGISWKQNVLSNAWLFIPKGAAHSVAAEAFLNYVNNPEHQAIFATATGYGAGAKDTAKYVAEKDRGNLTTAPQNLEQAVPIDNGWWQENGARMQTLWREWVTTGKTNIQ